MNETIIKMLLKQLDFDPTQMQQQAVTVIQAIKSRFDKIDLQLTEIRKSLTILAVAEQRRSEDAAEDVPFRGILVAPSGIPHAIGEQTMNDEDELSGAVIDEAPPTILELSGVDIG